MSSEVRSLLELPPWVANSYLQPPVIVSIALTLNTVVNVLGPDPNRVVLLLGVLNNSGPINYGPQGQVSQTASLFLGTQGFPLALSYWGFGPLVTYGWDAIAIGAGNNSAVVITQSLTSWPDGSTPSIPQMEAAMRARKRRLFSLSGALSDYWRKITGVNGQGK